MALTQPRNEAERIRWVANLTTTFLEHPLLDRPAAAARAGFTEVEFWWPFGATGRPAPDDVDAFVSAVTDSGVRLAHMNLWAGDMPSGQRGVLSYPDRSDEFRDSVDTVIRVAERTGVRLFNAPYGHRVDGLDHALQDATAVENLGYAARAVAGLGGTVLLEPVSGMPAYPLKTAQETVSMIDRVSEAAGITNLALLFDQFHLAVNGDDVARVAADYSDRVAHIQIADLPGRHEPGSGDFDLEGLVRLFLDAGYRGGFALEYFAEWSTDESLRTFMSEIATWALSPRADVS